MRPSHIAAICSLFLAAGANADQPLRQLLPTGQALTPLAAPGARFSPLITNIGPHPSYVADGAAAIAVSPDRREMLVLTSGFNQYNGADAKVVKTQSTQYIFRYAISARGAKRIQTLQVPNSYSGIAWKPDGSGFIVGGGVDDALYLFARRGSRFASAGKNHPGAQGRAWRRCPTAGRWRCHQSGRAARTCRQLL